MILCERHFEPLALLEFLKQQFPNIAWFYLDLSSGIATALDSTHKTMGFHLTADFSESYPLEINLTDCDETIISEYQAKIAKALSQNYQIKTVIDFTHPAHPHDPYYSLLYDTGDCFLVSDSGWDENEELVIIGPWPEHP